jgi:molecular chaperone DnaK (HSP70)
VGNLTCFVAVAKQGGIETADNEYSARSTPSYVGFTDKMRLVGQDAKNIQLTGSNSKNIIFNFKRLLGRKFSDPFVKDYSQNLPYKLVPVGDTDEVGVRVKYQGTEQTFSITQIVAAQLAKLKLIAEKALKRKVVDCVIAIPSFYTDIERRAMLDAARIADLNCLRLINDTTATGLCYGFYKKDLPDVKEAPRNVVFVDFGHSSLQVCIVAFNKGQMKVLAVTSDPYVGGMHIDKILVNAMAVDLQEKYKIKPLSEVRPYLKLVGEMEKLKILMSANKTKLPLNVECFMNDIDISAGMSRETMEGLCSKLFERVQKQFDEIIRISGVEKKDIYSVEVCGGSSRVSLFKDLVQNVFGQEMKTTLNADEAVARGCALQCAMLSSASQVRDKWTISDVCQFPITLKWKPFSDKDGSLEVFPYNHIYPATKLLTFYRKEPFDIEAIYSYPTNIPYSVPQIGTFTVHDVMPTPSGESAKIKVKVQLNKHGIFNLSEANLVEKIDDKDDSADGVKSPTKDSTEEKPVDSAVEENIANGEANGTQAMDTDGGDPTADLNEPKEPATAAEGAKKKTKVRNIPLPVKHQVSSLPADRITELKRVELDFQMVVINEQEKSDGKNAYEEYILDLRRQLGDELEPFVKEKDADKLRDLLEKAEDWLYDDGENCEKQVYLDKLYDMKKQGTPIITRKIEFETRPKVLEQFGARIQHFAKVLDMYAQKAVEYDHIPEDDMKRVKSAVDEKRKWFDDACNKLGRISKYDDPPILVSAISEQTRFLDSTCNAVVNKPKPKVTPPPIPEEKPAAGQSDATNGGDNMESDAAATPTSTTEEVD